MKLSLVVPCFNEEKTVDAFYAAAEKVLSALDCEYEIIFVDDGSTDKTKEMLKALTEKDNRVKAISFSRNFGQQAAILCGLRFSSGDAVIPIDCDLQDPVEVIPEMLEKWKQGYDIVHGRRLTRAGESAFKKLTAKTFYRVLNRMSSVEIPADTGDFKLLDRKVVDIIIKLPEHGKYLRGLESWVGFKQTFVDFVRQARFAGKTKYTLKKMLKLSSDGIYSNSAFPMKFFLRSGILLTVLSVTALIVFAILNKYIDYPWWIIAVNGLIGGLLMTQKGVSDIYLYRAYEEAKARPEYIVDEKYNF